jgi:hypothetical protein
MGELGGLRQPAEPAGATPQAQPSSQRSAVFRARFFAGCTPGGWGVPESPMTQYAISPRRLRNPPTRNLFTSYDDCAGERARRTLGSGQAGWLHSGASTPPARSDLGFPSLGTGKFPVGIPDPRSLT